MSTRHPASDGFGQVAGEYDRARPGYPREAIAWLARHAPLHRASVVLDVGAGTGKLSEALADLGVAITAIEPVAAMRAVLARRLPTVTALDGTATSLPVADASADAIVVGQAYHWFAGEPTLAEFQRVLRADGALALIWNARDRGQPVWRALDALTDSYRGTAPRHDDGAWRASLDTTERFVAVAEQRFPNGQRVERDELVERVASTSFIGALPHAERERLLDRVREIAAALDEPIPLDYVTEVFLLRRRPGEHARPPA